MKSKNIRYFIYFYLFLLLVYFGQGYILGENSSIGKFFILPAMGINIFYMLQCIKLKNTNATVKWFIRFVSLVVIYYFLGVMLIHNVPSSNQFAIFKTIILATTCIFPIYYWSIKGHDLTTVLLFFAVFYFFVIFAADSSEVHETDNYVNNIGYYYVCFMPYLLLIRKRIYIKIFLCLVLNLLVIESAKRGAIVVLGATDVLFFYYLFKDGQIPKSFFSRLLIFSLLGIAVAFVYYTFQTNDFVRERFIQMEDGQVSGRDKIYSNLIGYWVNQTSPISTMFGGGFCKVPTINRGQYAHNDWLQLLVDMGLVGVFIYVGVILNMFKDAIRIPDSTLKCSIVMIATIWFMKTLFSMSYLDENNFTLAILLGLCCAKLKMSKL